MLLKTTLRGLVFLEQPKALNSSKTNEHTTIALIALRQQHV